MVTDDKVAIEEDIQWHDYEMILVITPDIDEEQLEAAIDNVGRFITGKSGIVSDIDRWGKRRLAYPIRRFVEGSYILIKFKLKPEFAKELRANLRFSEEVLRHLLIRLDN